jgi:hypothetical protein
VFPPQVWPPISPGYPDQGLPGSPPGIWGGPGSLPPGIWGGSGSLPGGSPGTPTHPIAPGAPATPGQLPVFPGYPVQLPSGDLVMIWYPGRGWIWVPVPEAPPAPAAPKPPTGMPAPKA